jgi:DNA-binding IscR family transcriptional regulator
MGDAVAALLALDEAAAQGEAPTTVELASRQQRWMEPQLDDLHAELKQLHWVHMTRDGGWALARRLDDATLLDLYASRQFDLPRENDPDWPVDRRLAETLQQANTDLAGSLDVPLAAFRLQRADSIPLQPMGGSAGSDG